MSSDEQGSPTRQWELARQASAQMNQEALFADVEAQYIEIQKERDDLKKKLEDQTPLLREAQETSNRLREELQVKTEALATAKLEAQKHSEACKTVQLDLDAKQERMDRLQAEGDSLREEISRLTASNKEFSATITDLETKSKLKESSAIPLQYEVERLQKELDSITSHNRWLETELTARNEQLASYRTAQSKEATQLRSKLDQTSIERDAYLSDLTSLKEVHSKLEIRVNQMAKELRQTKEEAANAEAAFQEELTSERRISQIQKEQRERLERRHDDVVRQMEVMKKQAQEAFEASRGDQQSIRMELQAKSNAILEEQAETHRREVEVLKRKLEESERLRREAEDNFLSRPSEGQPMAVTDGDQLVATTETDDSGEPLALTDLLSKVVHTESQLHTERNKRKKIELRFERVQAEIAAKAPILMRQKQEYEIAVEQAGVLRERLNGALSDLQAAREENSELTVGSSLLKKQNRELEEENKIFAKQIQTFLVERAGGDVADKDVPTTVEQVQRQNQDLLREHRRLTDTISELESKLQSDQLLKELGEARAELETLRRERGRQQEKVESIATQRDLYRALIAQKDDELIGSEEEKTALQVARNQSQKAKSLEVRNKDLEQELADKQALLAAELNHKKSLEQQIERHEVHVANLTKSLDQSRIELSSAKAEVARANAESGYSQERCARTEEALQRSKNEVAALNRAREDLQRINIQLQETLSKANAEATKHENAFRQAEMNRRLADTRAETARASEARSAEELNRLRAEIARQGKLVESVHRIEASLAAKVQVEREDLRKEIDNLSQMLSDEKAKHAKAVEQYQSQVRDLETSSNELATQKNSASAAALKSEKQMLQLSSEKKALESKCAELEAQLNSARQKLGQTGLEEMESTLQAQIEALKTDLESAGSELKISKEREIALETLAKSHEDAVKKLTTSIGDSKKAYAEEINDLKKKLETIRKEASSKQEIIAALTKDLSGQRGEQEKVASELNQKIALLQKEIESYKADAVAAQAQIKASASEISELRQEIAIAQSNYERELALHSEARTFLRAAKESAESELKLRLSAEEQLNNLEEQLGEERTAMQQEKSTLENDIEVMKKRLNESQSQNNLLHTQLDELGGLMDKLQSSKIQSTEEAEQGANSEESQGLTSMHKAFSELREVVQFLRSENEMLQTQLDSAQRIADREKAASSVIRRSLDEARAELKASEDAFSREMSASLDKDLKERMRNTEEQLTLLRESNQLLRDESEKLKKALDAKDEELNAASDSSKSTETSLRNLEVEKAALVAEKASLTRDLQDWKARLNSLVSKFNQIDPVEHEKALKDLETYRKESEQRKSQITNLEQQIKEVRLAAARVNKENRERKVQDEANKKTIARLSAEKEAAMKARKETPAVGERDKLVANEKELASTKTELKGANERNERLLEKLRQFQKMIRELRSKEKDLNEKLAAAETAAKNSKAVAAAPEPPNQPGESTNESEAAATDVSATASKPRSRSTAPAETSNAKAKDEGHTLPRVPVGGFTFGPSASSKHAEEARPPKSQTGIKLTQSVPGKAPGATSSSTEEGGKIDGRRGAPTVVSSAPSSPVRAPESTEVSTSPTTTGDVACRKTDDTKEKRRPSGETREMSIKQKLMEKRRRLQATLDRAAKEKAKKTDEQVGKTEAEPAKKRAKIATELPSGNADAKEAEEKTENEPVSTLATADTVGTEPPKDTSDATNTVSLSADAMDVERPSEIPDKSKKQDGPEKPKDDSASPKAQPKPEGSVEAKTESSAEKPTESDSPSPFGNTFGGEQGKNAPITFGKTSSLTSNTPAVFGGKSPSGSNTFGSGSAGGAFLANMKPPGSSDPPVFAFSSSGSIKLPTPSQSTQAPSPFGAFSSSTNPFSVGGVRAKPLFGTSVAAPAAPLPHGEVGDTASKEGNDGKEEAGDKQG